MGAAVATSFAPAALPWTPRAYQRVGIKLVVSHGAMGLVMDPGLGKTTVILAAMKILRAEGLVRLPLVVAPLRPVYEVWPREVEKWENFSSTSVTILHGSKKDDRLDAVIAGEDQSDLCLINYEGLAWLAGRLGYRNVEGNRWRKMRRSIGTVGRTPLWPFDVLVLDESTRVKSTGTARFHLVRSIIGEFKRRYILTGTPAPNGLMDLFGQIFILDGGHALGAYVTHYRNRYFNPTEVPYQWEIRPGAEREIYAKIAPLVYRVDAEDELDLPKLVVDDVWVTLPPRARQVYLEFERDMFADLDGTGINASSAAVASSKCGQVANGGVYDEGHAAHDLHHEKIDAVADLVEQLQGKPALVAYDTHHDLARLKKRFPAAPVIGGGVPTKKVSAAIVDWNAGRLPVLLVHPASAAHGLNLQESGNVVIWHSLTWDFEHYDQLIRRLRRQGQRAKRVMCHRVLARDTVDEAKVIALGSKDKTQRGCLDALRAYAAKRR